MAYHNLNFPDDNGFGRVYGDEDFHDDNLIEIPCEFCQDLFPMLLLMEHQTACRPDLARFVEPTIQEIEAEFLNLENTENSVSTNALPINVVELPPLPVKSVLTKETSASLEQIKNIVNEEDDLKAIEKALQENEIFTSKKENIEEKKLSFRYPPNPILDKDHHVPNELTESDDEENESLEEFWKKADIKLAKRLRMLGEKQCVENF